MLRQKVTEELKKLPALIYVMHGHLKIVIKWHSSVEISTFQVSGYEVSKTEINLVGIHNNKDACPDVIFFIMTSRHLEEAIELLVRSNDLPIGDLDVLGNPT